MDNTELLFPSLKLLNPVRPLSITIDNTSLFLPGSLAILDSAAATSSCRFSFHSICGVFQRRISIPTHTLALTAQRHIKSRHVSLALLNNVFSTWLTAMSSSFSLFYLSQPLPYHWNHVRAVTLAIACSCKNSLFYCNMKVIPSQFSSSDPKFLLRKATIHLKTHIFIWSYNLFVGIK